MQLLDVKVSICISVCNTGKYLRRCLDSLVVQTLKEIEIIIVDNGSTDDSRMIMEEYKRNYQDIDITIVPQPDKGLAQGSHTGIRNARGE